MSIQVIKMDANGVGIVSFENLSRSERMDIELSAMLKPSNTLLCITCHKPFPGGNRTSYCEEHR
jgi:hypothetical protein